MTLQEFVTASLASFGFTRSAQMLAADFIRAGVNPDAEYSADTHADASRVLVVQIPALLVQQPKRVSEGDLTIEYNADGLKAYYRILCSELGLPDPYAEKKPVVRDRSNLW